ncbi:MAG: hypothetical protein V3U87_10025 [Methylococcaceae bacterium]
MKILYISKNDGTDIRIDKECRTLQKLNHEVVFLGWDRNPLDEKFNILNSIEKVIYLKSAEFGSNKVLFNMPGYYIFLIKQIINYKPDVIHVVNEDLAFLVLPFKLIYKYRLVCDIFDSISLKNTSANKVLSMTNFVAKIVWSMSDKLIVTDEARQKKLKKYLRKSYIVQNYPEDSQPFLYKTILSDTDKITLYVAGTLNIQRGITNLHKIINKRNDIRIIAAGWIYDDSANDFINNMFVNYLGVITPEKSLEMAAKCDAVYAFYDPCNNNNIMASPNKVYDALCVGRPILINEESLISKWIKDEKLGYIVPYHDLVKLESTLDEILTNKNNYVDRAMHLRQKFEEGYSWKQAEINLIKLYSDL